MRFLDEHFLNTTEEKAVFSEEGKDIKKLKTFSPGMANAVADLYENQKNTPATSLKGGDGKDFLWYTIGKGFGKFTSKAILFSLKDDNYCTEYNGHFIKINSTCNKKDSETWLKAYFETRKTVAELSLVSNLTIMLGGYSKHNTVVAAAGVTEMLFFNHHTTDRLFACGIEEVTKGVSSIKHLIIHELVHLLDTNLNPALMKLQDFVYKTNEKKPEELNKLAFSSYLKEILPKVKFNKTIESAIFFSNEVIAEIYSRHFILKEAIPEECQTVLPEFWEIIKEAQLKPIDLNDYEGHLHMYRFYS